MERRMERRIERRIERGWREHRETRTLIFKVMLTQHPFIL